MPKINLDILNRLANRRIDNVEMSQALAEMSITSDHSILWPIVLLFCHEILGDNGTDKNDCNICFCDDCQEDDWCYYPLHQFLDRHELINPPESKNKKEKRSPEDEDVTSTTESSTVLELTTSKLNSFTSNQKGASKIRCLTTSWEEKKDNGWVKVR